MPIMSYVHKIFGVYVKKHNELFVFVIYFGFITCLAYVIYTYFEFVCRELIRKFWTWIENCFLEGGILRRMALGVYGFIGNREFCVWLLNLFNKTKVGLQRLYACFYSFTYNILFFECNWNSYWKVLLCLKSFLIRIKNLCCKCKNDGYEEVII